MTNISTTVKGRILNVGRDLGLFRLFGHCSTRRNQLLILSYHGISSGEPYHYNSFMFMPVVVFERRMQILRDTGANIVAGKLPNPTSKLDENVSLAHALTLLSQGRLQPRSVVITFDDGWADFRQNAYPILKRYSMPATVYLTTSYERDFVTRFGTLRLRIARSRKRGFLPEVQQKFQRRAEEVSLLIREAFLRGISTRQVGRLVAMLTGEPVSPQTVSRLSRDLDEAVRQFHQARLQDEWAYLFLDGVSLRMRRPSGRQRVHMLVAYGVRGDGTRQLLSFMRSKGESQSAWEGRLEDLYRRGLKGEELLLIVTDGCPGLAAAIETVYPRALHQGCWVHKMRNILEKVRRRDHDAVKADAQAIYRAESRRQAEAAFRAFRRRWQPLYGAMVRQLERDLPELLSFFSFPRHLWRKLRTTNIIERCFVEVRRRTRPMVCFVNVKSVDRIIYSIFQRFNLEWKNRTLRVFTQAA